MDRSNARIRRTLLTLLVTALAVVDLAVVFAIHAFDFDWNNEPTIFSGMLFGFATGNVGLLGWWWVFGRGTPVPWRTLAVIAGVVGWSVALTTPAARPRLFPELSITAIVLLHLVVQLVVPATVLALARTTRLCQIVAVSDDAAAQRAEMIAERQFTVGTILGWMTTLALVYALVFHMIGREEFRLAMMNAWALMSPTFFVVHFVSVLFAVVIPATCLSARAFRPWTKIVVMSLVYVPLAVYVPTSFFLADLSSPRPTIPIECLLSWNATQFVLLVATFTTLQVAGFRLVRPPAPLVTHP